MHVTMALGIVRARLRHDETRGCGASPTAAKTIDVSMVEAAGSASARGGVQTYLPTRRLSIASRTTCSWRWRSEHDAVQGHAAVQHQNSREATTR